MTRFTLHEDRQLSALVGVPAESVWATTCRGYWCRVWARHADGTEYCTQSKHFGTAAAAERWGREHSR
jgi:hypothetical protein